MDDFFELQDDIVARIAATVGPEITLVQTPHRTSIAGPAGALVPPGARSTGGVWSLPAGWPDPISLTALASDRDDRYRGCARGRVYPKIRF
jgi:hypothetical protein